MAENLVLQNKQVDTHHLEVYKSLHANTETFSLLEGPRDERQERVHTIKRATSVQAMQAG